VLIQRALRLAAAMALLSTLALGAATAVPSASHSNRKSCSPGYVYANLSWGEKCLRAGQFCKVGNPEYHQYGFDCPASGHLVAYARGAGSGTRPTPKPANNPSTETKDTGANGHCGVERWTVKTLQDRPRLLAVKPATVAYLVSRPAPADLPDTRLPFERHVFRVTAAVTLVRPEADSDFHLVLNEGKHTMIAESPASSCTKRATPLRRRQMAQARQKVELCHQARITGVAFFDFQHGQTGVAPNAIELHPVLSFTCLQP
jgi:hypothetical protein